MTREVKGLLLLAAMLLAFALGGCSGEDEPEPQEPQKVALTTAEEQPEVTDPAQRALVAAVRSSASRYPTFDRYPDEGIVSVGLLVCSGFEGGLPMVDVVRTVMGGSDAYAPEAVSFIGLAVGEVCPEYAGAVY